MVLEEKHTYVAYRCPHCGQAVLGFVGSFALSADMLKLKCPCKKSEMVMTVTSDKKIRLTVPCVFCPNPHQFVVSQSLFFGRDLFLLNCPYANMDVCFVGDEEKIGAALEENAKELNRLYAEISGRLPKDGADGEKEKTEPEPEEEAAPLPDPESVLPDAQVYDVVRFLVRELEDDCAIDCPCQSGNYDFCFIENGIRVYCPECGAYHDFEANSVETAREFLQVDELHLTLPEDGEGD